MANFSFNANNVAPSAAFEPIPAGKYNAIISATEIKPTSTGNGKRLNITFDIVGGEYNNRKVFEGLNIENPNQDAQRISLENLSAICHAVGVLNLTQTEQLHNKPLTIVVKIKPASGEYDAKNVIKGYEAAGAAGGSTGASRPTSGGTTARPAAAAAQRPAAQQAPAQRAQAAAPARGPAAGRPAAANAPVRQAPTRQAEPAPVEEVYEEQHPMHDGQYDDADAGQFEGDAGDAGGAPWDN